MKVTLEFDSFEDRHEMRRVMAADAMYNALWDIMAKLRADYKYAPDETPEIVLDYLEILRGACGEILANHGIDLDSMNG